MPQTFYKIWIHLIWSTKNREPLLHKQIRDSIYNHIHEKSKFEGYHLDIINGMPDHIHCLISLNPKHAISEVVNKLKGESAHWINSEKLITINFAWQSGFSAFSVSESQVDKIRTYILNQEQHHKKMTFDEEVQKLLKLHKAEEFS